MPPPLIILPYVIFLRLIRDRSLGKSVDLTREAFSAEKFDVALDKACLDSIVCSTQARTDNYLQQIDRWALFVVQDKECR